MTIEAFLKSSAINTRATSVFTKFVEDLLVSFDLSLIKRHGHGAPCYDWVMFLEPGHSEDHVLISKRCDEEPVFESDSFDCVG
ncbi:hypothetical protein M378DRAFT_17759 [Amanita muscaria Koide BX008]|uniref:Uncharacterized protein n=1 Tax=Amanita muscaria (strain Koide BX008) TaxID=946122 RepID=A0A0C2SNT5_AMAMK|nr:hypothetical protein M378DRAFT_17759 [Amanita muscaria Koide BX008]